MGIFFLIPHRSGQKTNLDLEWNSHQITIEDDQRFLPKFLQALKKNSHIEPYFLGNSKSYVKWSVISGHDHDHKKFSVQVRLSKINNPRRIKYKSNMSKTNSIGIKYKS